MGRMVINLATRKMPLFLILSLWQRNVYFGIDNDIRERLQAKLMMAVLNFRTEK